MNAIKDLGVAMAAMTAVTTLLTVFFVWRARLLSQLRGGSHEH